jgi:hypothetical protein
VAVVGVLLHLEQPQELMAVLVVVEEALQERLREETEILQAHLRHKAITVLV